MSINFRHGASLHVWGAILTGQKLPLVRFNLARARTVNKQRIAAEKIDSKVYAEQILWGPLQDYVNGASVWTVVTIRPMYHYRKSYERQRRRGRPLFLKQS